MYKSSPLSHVHHRSNAIHFPPGPDLATVGFDDFASLSSYTIPRQATMSNP
jgi:hypothetical protein